ncbi:hypothetical protein LJK88_13975 [Paenibacillus sp. P26]|nr:hypothetical protein LJK88_13975 [Paenibacillus sp. P26]UUZ96978.1 hypothetical protein LJK87_23765 [Paenibacillus sp. P25]
MKKLRILIADDHSHLSIMVGRPIRSANCIHSLGETMLIWRRFAIG